MNLNRSLRTLAAILAVSSSLAGVHAVAKEPPTLIERLNQAGPEAQALARRAGTWDVTITSWDAPGAAPVVITGLVAERRMIGPMLEEVLQPGPGTTGAPFSRADYLTFNRLEGRWQYMSMDSRVPDGLMSAWSLDADPEQRVFMSFLPFATPSGTGAGANGQMLRMEQVILRQDADHELKEQYFTAAGSAPVKWLGNRYSYTRRQ
jgi:hypothetical protein